VKKIRKNRRFTVVLERDEDGFYVASSPALAGCHTQGRSLDQAMRRIRAAAELWLEVHQVSWLQLLSAQNATFEFAMRNRPPSASSLPSVARNPPNSRTFELSNALRSHPLPAAPSRRPLSLLSS